MNTPMTRRSLLTSTIPAAAVVASTRPSSAVPTRRREHWDPVAEWVCGHEEIACCTPAERAALVSARPEAATWTWLDFGDRHVGISPRRPSPELVGEPRTIATKFMARLEEVQGRRSRDKAGA